MIGAPMKVAILSAATAPLYQELLDKRFDELIESSQCFLFYILCGYVKGSEKAESVEKSLGEIWAEKHGAPILYISEKSTELLLNRLFSEADYIIFLLDGNPFINNAFMRYKMTGKHGTVIKINKPKEK